MLYKKKNNQNKQFTIIVLTALNNLIDFGLLIFRAKGITFYKAETIRLSEMFCLK